MPIRVPQASLAPQLRDAGRTHTTGSAEDLPQASAEAARSTMAALPRGWELGRSSSDDDTDVAAPATGNGAGDETPGEADH